MNNNILVIGDAMLDTYTFGRVNRVSPESPVPIIIPEKTSYCLGGASNVARNIAALGGNTSVCFVVGNDVDGKLIINELDKWKINHDHVIISDNIKTINKTRLIGNGQQIVRVDCNDSYNLDFRTKEKLYNSLKEAIQSADIVVISDYGKGLCSSELCEDVINWSRDKIIIVDPKGIDWSKYSGASIITPNLMEINTFTGKDVNNNSSEIEAAFNGLNKKINVDYIILTRSEEGMSILGNESLVHIPSNAREVFDVSGAGDTVVAALAVYLNKSLSNIEVASRLANIAAGLAVAKHGTAVVYKDEVQKEISYHKINSRESKIYSMNDYEKLRHLIEFWKLSGNKIIATNGCFDILHRGHVKMLEEAKKYGDKLIVAVNSDDSVKRLKGRERPINSQMDRAHILSAIDIVDTVVLFDPVITPLKLSEDEYRKLNDVAKKSYGEAPMYLMKMISPDVYLKGGDYKKDDIPEAIFSKQTVILDYEYGYSTTGIIDRINNR